MSGKSTEISVKEEGGSHRVKCRYLKCLLQVEAAVLLWLDLLLLLYKVINFVSVPSWRKVDRGAE